MMSNPRARARSRRLRPLSLDEVTSRVQVTGDLRSVRTGRASFGYMPSQSLYDGEFRDFEDYNSQDENEEQMNSIHTLSQAPDSVSGIPETSRRVRDTSHTPLRGSSLYNTGPTPSYPTPQTASLCSLSNTSNSADLVAQIQQQQQLLCEVLEHQKEMKEKQQAFQSELENFKQQVSNSPSSSQDSGGEKIVVKKSRVCRDLSVSTITVACYSSLSFGLCVYVFMTLP